VHEIKHDGYRLVVRRAGADGLSRFDELRRAAGARVGLSVRFRFAGAQRQPHITPASAIELGSAAAATKGGFRV
jgi:hypothetical protein